jgi:SAM-dependent methyltransferase
MYLKNYSIKIAKDVLIRFPKRIVRLLEYVGEMNTFRRMSDRRFEVKWKDAYPCLTDKIKTTPFDAHYTYHPAWAARILAKTRPALHVDFSSILYFGTMLSAFIPVKFYDYRPAELALTGWEGAFADLCNLDIDDNTYSSVSCMHTVEHIGLGRYGDKLDAEGDIKAINELIRITKPDGDILFVTPVGKQRIEFNGQRVYSYEHILQLFTKCRLMEFSLIPDRGTIIENADPALIQLQKYGCGCFWFKKN